MTIKRAVFLLMLRLPQMALAMEIESVNPQDDPKFQVMLVEAKERAKKERQKYGARLADYEDWRRRRLAMYGGTRVAVEVEEPEKSLGVSAASPLLAESPSRVLHASDSGSGNQGFCAKLCSCICRR